MQINKKLSASVLGAAAIVALLAGCSNADADKASDNKDKASASSAPKPAAAPATGKCVKGEATIADRDLKDGKVKLDDCATVYVISSNASIELGSVKKVAFEGTGNKVTFTGEKPEVVAGEGNSVEAAKK